MLYNYIRKASVLNNYFIFLGHKALFIFLINVVIILGVSSFLNHEKFAVAVAWLIQFLIILSISLISYWYDKVVAIWGEKKI